MNTSENTKAFSHGRRDMLRKIAAGTAGLTVAGSGASCSKPAPARPLKAGFARVAVTPPLGTPMTGFGDRDYDPSGCKGIHDDLHANALYLSQGDCDVLIMGFDLLFFSRDEADRFKGAIGRVIDLAPVNILLNTSHTHTGPKVGTWYYTPSDPLYLHFLEEAIVRAAKGARDSLREVTVLAGKGRTKVPVSRRRKLTDGTIEFAPDPEGTVCDTLPVCLFRDLQGKPVCMLFSVSCHPSTVKGVDRSFWISADYPGAAMGYLDKHLGAEVSMFLQGAGGDSKPSVIAGEGFWRAGAWGDVDEAGKMVYGDVVTVMEKQGIRTIEPNLTTAQVEMQWALKEPLSRSEYEKIVKNPKAHSESMPEVMQTWAKEQIAKLDRGYTLKSSVPITAHGIHIGNRLRLVGIEGELVAELGLQIQRFYTDGVTFAMGYSDGAQMYLPTTAMLAEGGYEVESYWEYRQPAPLAGGHEKILDTTLAKLFNEGIT